MMNHPVLMLMLMLLCCCHNTGLMIIVIRSIITPIQFLIVLKTVVLTITLLSFTNIIIMMNRPYCPIHHTMYVLSFFLFFVLDLFVLDGCCLLCLTTFTTIVAVVFLCFYPVIFSRIITV